MKNKNLIGGDKDLSAVLVIFGGTGDLTHRKLMPALYNMLLDGLVPENFQVVSIGRRDKTEESIEMKYAYLWRNTQGTRWTRKYGQDLMI